jgi:hypothetical protein
MKSSENENLTSAYASPQTSAAVSKTTIAIKQTQSSNTIAKK